MLLILLIHELQRARAAQLRGELVRFRQQQEEKRSTFNQVIHFLSILTGTMASSAVSTVLFVHNEVGNQAATSTGACIYSGDAASFHEWEFRTRLRIAGKTGDQYIEAMSKVCDGLQEVGLANLREIIDGRPSGINTLISHTRGIVSLN